MTGWELYWLLKMDNVVELFKAISIASIVTTFICGIILVMFHEELPDVGIKQIKKILPVSIVALFVFATLTVFAPTTKQLAIIKVVPPIVNNEQVQEIPLKLVEFVDEWIDELRPEVEDGK